MSDTVTKYDPSKTPRQNVDAALGRKSLYFIVRIPDDVAGMSDEELAQHVRAEIHRARPNS